MTQVISTSNQYHTVTSVLQTIHEEQDQLEEVTVQITLTKTCLYAEYQRLNVYPFCTMNIGNHQVYLTPDDVLDKPDKLHFEYCGLIWLFRNRSQPTLQAVVSYRSMQKFIAYKYGMSLFEVYQNPEQAKKSLQKTELLAVLQEVQISEDANQISGLLAKSNKKSVNVLTDDFGIVSYPSAQDISDFLSKAKVMNGGYEAHIKQRVDSSK